MRFRPTRNEFEMEMVNLLASILLCYPEISKVTLVPKEKGILFSMSLSAPPDNAYFEEKKEFILESLQVYNQLEGTANGGKCAIYYENCAIQIFRDWSTISKGEIGLMVTLLRDIFQDSLLREENRGIDSEIIYTNQEMMDTRFNKLRDKSIRHSMIGIRDEGRVMVFDK